MIFLFFSAIAAESEAPATPADPPSAPAEAPPATDPSTPPPSPADLSALEAEIAAALAAEPAPAAPPEPARGALSLQSLNPDIAFIADVAAAWFSADEPRMVGGHDPTSTGFHLQQLELAVGKSVDPYFRFDANLVFSLYGVEIEEVYATTLALPGRFQLRAGQFLTRFGRINNSHPHAWDFVDQNLVIGRVFGGEGNRGLGLEASWLAPLPWSVEVIGSTTTAAGEATARSFYGGEDLGIDTPLDLQSTLAVKQFFPLGTDASLLWGLSAANGPNPTGIGNRTDLFGTDLYFKFRPVSRGASEYVAVQTEWIVRRRQVPDDVWTDLTGTAQVAWRFAPRWGSSARYELGLAAVGADGKVVDDTLDPEWSSPRHRGSAALTYWPTEFSRIRLQGDADVATWDDTPDFAVMTAFEFAVGAHGSHAF